MPSGGVTESLMARVVSHLPDPGSFSWSHALLLLLALLVPLLYFWLRELMGVGSRIRKLPGPRPILPLIGHAYLMPKDETDVLSTVVEYCNKFPGFFHMRLWEDYIMINSAEAAESIFSSSVHISKGDMYNGLILWLGDGLLTSTGEKWHKRRKMLTPAFHFSILDEFMQVFNEQSSVLVDKLRNTSGKKVDIFPFITKATLDVICEAAMGVQIGAQQGARSDYVQAVYDMGLLTFVRFMQPWFRWEFLYRCSSYYRREVEALKLLHGFTNSVIHTRRQELINKQDDTSESQAKKRKAFLDLLLASTVDGQPLSDRDIRDEVDTFMFEGHDTTSSGINWALYNLGRNPDIQAKAYAEACEVCGDDPSMPITRDQMSKLNYLELVIKETLRLYPPVPMIGRRLQSDVVIDGHDIPQRCMISLVIFCIHRDPRHWPDPDRFDPERFTPENSRGRHPFCYVPFSAGPRNCIGQKFALMEEKVIIASVLRAFEIKAFDKEEDITLRGDVILRLKGGLWLSFTPRH